MTEKRTDWAVDPNLQQNVADRGGVYSPAADDLDSSNPPQGSGVPPSESGTFEVEIKTSPVEEAGNTCQPGIVHELENYHYRQTLVTVNRDGDRYYVECPQCHSTDLNTQRITSCRRCHTHFTFHSEDGVANIKVQADFSSISAGGEVTLLQLGGSKDYFYRELLPRNSKCIDDLRQTYPNLKVTRLHRDLQEDGKDAHSHAPYKRFVLVPLD